MDALSLGIALLIGYAAGVLTCWIVIRSGIKELAAHSDPLELERMDKAGRSDAEGRSTNAL
jgi:hypothetical protein